MLVAATQTSWFIDRITGKPGSAGTLLDPVDSASTIATRWAGNSGQRPSLPAGTTLVLRGSAPTILHAGTIATASMFARTSAAGQIRITDVSITDFRPFVPALFTDSTTGAVSWLYDPPVGASATGIVSQGRTALTSLPVDLLPPYSLPTSVNIAATDTYQLSSLTPVYFGIDSMTRGGASSNPGPTITITWLNGATVQPDVIDPLSILLDVDGVANVVLYHLHGTAVVRSLESPGPTDTWRPQCTTDAESFSGPTIELQECRVDQRYIMCNGHLRLINCASTFGALQSGWARTGGALVLLSGFSYGGVFAQEGGILYIDNDFLIRGNGPIGCINGSVAFIGNFSRWGVGPALIVEAAIMHLQTIFGDGGHTIYGVVGQGKPVISFTAHSQGGAVQYNAASGGTAVGTFNFDSIGPNWIFPVIGTIGFGFNNATGVWIGPTPNTWANLDAALVAGAGFGSAAVDPVSGDSVRSFIF